LPAEALVNQQSDWCSSWEWRFWCSRHLAV